MQNSSPLRDQPRYLSGRDDPASHTYRIDEGVLVELGDGLKPTTHMFHEQRAAEDGTFELRTGPAPQGYQYPDTTVRVRYTTPKRSTT